MRKSSPPDAPDPASSEEDEPAAPRRPRAKRASRSTANRPSAVSAAEAMAATVQLEAMPEPTSPDSRPHPAARHAVQLDPKGIDPDVEKVIRRLVRNGYEAYLVGGCVRDLLLNRKPKDFDVATSARPEEVRDLFRNSRVIGRRFRLVHVLFSQGKVIEVATFRRSPQPDDDTSDPERDGDRLLIRSDNVFGEAPEDALRRDFTINALFYDLERGEILDWVGGLADVEGKVVNTIGEPALRFREDPVRILRALKFAGRLDLGIAPHVYDAIVACRESLALAARPRIAEEILRMMRGGRARRTLFLAWETGVLDVLLPELAALLYDSFAGLEEEGESAGDRVFRLMDYVDQRSDNDPLDDAVLWTLLLLEPLKEATDGAKDRTSASLDLLEPAIEKLAIPRRFADAMRRIVGVLPRILSGKAGRFARTDLFAPALDVAEADLFARGLPLEPVSSLRRTAPAAPQGRRPAGRGSHLPRPRPTPRH